MNEEMMMMIWVHLWRGVEEMEIAYERPERV